MMSMLAQRRQGRWLVIASQNTNRMPGTPPEIEGIVPPIALPEQWAALSPGGPLLTAPKSGAARSPPGFERSPRPVTAAIGAGSKGAYPAPDHAPAPAPAQDAHVLTLR